MPSAAKTEDLRHDVDALRTAILEAALTHVAFDGWSHAALRAGAADAGLDASDVQRAFPDGPAELLAEFSRRIDHAMLQELERRDVAAMRVRERVTAGVRVRLELLEPHREAVRRGLAFLALPANLALGTRLLYRTVDAIWYAAGDTATDYNFYTKRALLAGVYASTLLYWLDDRSEDYADTWAFLDRRIADAMRIPQAVGRFGGAGAIGKTLGRVPSPWRVLQRVARERRARYPGAPSRPTSDPAPHAAPGPAPEAPPEAPSDTGRQ